MPENTSPYVLHPGEGEALWFGDFLITVKAAAETNDRFSVLEQQAANGAATPLHVHPEDDETLYILEGQLSITLDGGQSSFRAGNGSCVHIPGGCKHALRVDSDTARFMDVTTSQHERFLRAAAVPGEASTLPPQSAPDMDRLVAAAREYRVEILGPPPEQ